MKKKANATKIRSVLSAVRESDLRMSGYSNAERAALEKKARKAIARGYDAYQSSFHIMNYNKFYPILTCVLFLYIIVAVLTFAFRHPWATQTERTLYLKEALLFERVSYTEARKNYR